MEPHILLERQWNPIYYLKDNEVADPLDGALAHEDVGWSDRDLRQSSQKLHGCQCGVEVILPWHHQTVTHQWCCMAKQAVCSVCGQSYWWKQTDASQTVVAFTLHKELGLREGQKATLSKNKKISGAKCSLHLNKITSQTSVSRIQWSSFLWYYCNSKYNTLVINTPLPLITFPHHHPSPPLSPSLQQVCGHR